MQFSYGLILAYLDIVDLTELDEIQTSRKLSMQFVFLWGLI